MESPNRNVSTERKAGYTVGLVISVIGGLLFGLGFLLLILNIGNFSHFESSAKGSAFCWFGGMALLIVGGIIRRTSAGGLAGSGVVLDPEQARKDLEPYSRMAGGMANDALSEIDLRDKLGSSPAPPVQVIKVKCQKCGVLNDEDARYCKGCGGSL